MRVCVIGGGLAGIAAALEAADRGADVVLLERRRTLGGLATSYDRGGYTFDNGQHVFLRCCTAYRSLLKRLGARDEVRLQPRLDVPVLAPGATRSSIRRSSLPAPLHLGASLAAYRHLSVTERLRAATCSLALRRLDPDDPVLDATTFGAWLAARHQSPRAIERLWNLIALPTINLGADEASLALAARVFRTGLLDHRDAGDIGWSLVPLRRLHDELARHALARAGVDVRAGRSCRSIGVEGPSHEVTTDDGTLRADAVVVATPPSTAATLGALAPDVAERLGTSPIVNVHLLFDRRVTDLEFFAAVDSPVQFVFDRTSSTGLAAGQCLAISLSAADAALARPSHELVDELRQALAALVPAVARATLVDAAVTREHAATFRGAPGTAALRPSPRTARPGVYVAGAWCSTGWPATMEGAVRSGRAAAAAALGEPAPAVTELAEVPA